MVDIKDKTAAGDGRRIPRARRIHLPKILWKTNAEADERFMAMVAVAERIDSPMPRKKITPMSDRKLIEYCCGADSLLGRPKYIIAVCAVKRLSEGYLRERLRSQF